MRNKWKNFSFPRTCVHAFSMKTKEMLDPPIRQLVDLFGQFFELLGLSSLARPTARNSPVFSTCSLKSEPIPYRLETSSRSALRLARDNASGIRGCGLRPVQPVRDMRVTGVRRSPLLARWRNTVALRFPRSGSPASIPAMPVGAKSTERRDPVIKATPGEASTVDRRKIPGPFARSEEAKQNSPGCVFKERRQLQLRLRGKFASMFAASF